jgi:hypothetical protein
MEIDEGMQDKEDSCEDIDDLLYNTPFVYIDPCS